MSARIIVLADRRANRLETDSHPAGSSNPHGAVSADAHGLVAAARALAASMERTKTQSAKMRETYRWLAVAAQAIVLDTEAILSSVEKLSGLRTSASRT